MSEDPPLKRRKFDPAKLLEKQGWKKGQGLGREGQGAVTYVTAKRRNDSYGIGADMSEGGDGQDLFARDMARRLEKALGSVSAKEAKKRKKAQQQKEAAAAEAKFDGKFVSGGLRQIDDDVKRMLAGAEDPDAVSGEQAGTKKGKKEKKEKKEKKDKKAKKEKKKKKEAKGGGDSDDSSDDDGGPLGQLDDAALFAAMGGARFGKLGRHSNSSQRWARIQAAEAKAGAEHVAAVRRQQAAKKRIRSPRAGPRKSPRKRKSPASSPASTPRSRPAPA